MMEPADKERTKSETVEEKSTMLTAGLPMRGMRRRRKQRNRSSPICSIYLHEAAACRCMSRN
jgi:hypothetical protein